MKVAFDVGGRISKLRRRDGLMQWELAGKIGCSQKHISDIERGTTSPTLRECEKMASLFQIDPVELIAGGPSKASEVAGFTPDKLKRIENLARELMAILRDCIPERPKRLRNSGDSTAP